MTRAPAPAKLNLALVVGARRHDGKHEVCTVYQHIDLADRIALEPAPRLEVRGFAEDTLVASALTQLAAVAKVEPRWSVRIRKRIPVAAGLGGGSSDAATALRLANETLARPLARRELHALAREVGADVPFFLEPGPRLGEGDGSELRALDLPQDYWVVVLLPNGAGKASTRAVYERFDEHDGAIGFEERREELRRRLERVRRPRDLAALPPNDLASSPLAAKLEGLGAFRADVSGAGPAVYGLFHHRPAAAAAAEAVSLFGRTWIAIPAWYG